MKKRKPSEPPSPDFKNNPFKSLKGFSPKSRSEQPPSRKRAEQSEDDSELFFRAVAGAKKIEERDESPGIKPGTAAARKNAATTAVTPPEETDKRIFLQAMQKMGTTMKSVSKAYDEDVEFEKPRPAGSRVRQLRRGTIRLGGELDLHGFLKDEALLRLDHFISSAYATGREAVLVITGKGINSPEGPVLQGAVASWLRQRGKGMVAEFASAPRELGGSGAFVVFLRKK